MTDIAVTDNCKNPDSYGEICVKCNKCGRFGEQKMTRAEAIRVLKDEMEYKHDYPYDKQAYEMAISTLECGKMLEVCYDQVKQERDIAIEQLKELGYELGQKIEPCNDAISREAVINQMYEWLNTCEYRKINATDYFIKRIIELPPVQPIREIKPKEEMTVEETISDLIWLLGSNLLDKDSEDTVLNAIYYLENQPSRKGHWIDRSEGGRIKYPWMEAHECDKCGEYGSAAWNFCPNCGADMRGDSNADSD